MRRLCQTGGLGRTIGYTAANLPASVTLGARTVAFSYDPDGDRFMQTAPEGTTLYVGAFGVQVELVGASQWNEYLVVGGTMVGARFVTPANGTVWTRYFLKDHLGSVSILTDETGAVVERGSYDAWGKRRAPGGSDDPSGSLVSQTTRGFTSQEHLAEVGLIHFNARLYDPTVARFTSADSLVPHPGDAQSFNRYSYVRNLPLSAVDPSGHSDLPAIVVPEPSRLPPIVVPGSGWGSGGVFIPGSGGSGVDFGSITFPGINLPNIPGMPSFPAGTSIQYVQFVYAIRGNRPVERWGSFARGNGMTWFAPSVTAPAPASQQPASPPVAAGFALGSPAYEYSMGALQTLGRWAGECLEMCGGISYFTGSNGLRAGVATLLDLCGNFCQADVHVAVGDPAGALPLGVVGLYARFGRSAAFAGNGAKLENLTAGEIMRIQNAANRTQTEITVVGSRAKGTAQSHSDWDYVLPPGTKGRTQHSLSSSLPEGPRAIGEPRNQDFFRGEIRPNESFITFRPEPR
ncbi:hypothetical protein JQ557_25980 [Bradyrhizobium sp. U87765 SZCCT0131]|uniref:RHS repeat domain-containing protein n=1 Tax=unclassified Bradyrhizobium TaxID=2631580 RepID=UPI001BADE376|nr:MULTISPECIES: RHS repeat-associated core domain-containing protein [unclassified Bradyrhizobium]MBR1221474.1 hypothetical protein [Bradyrhizobium sp. U87765 SZCCT0131]MBR1264603.1 hypothetical protein [Bradyrhizobium sp. U87765 SZCCT0134]MBR1304491.1 hypothetical protein [Bradyrhizobium sp. U87765 SZCCT0110]MBR1322652.1 hypothetical protein [Bradyrhizobium sp. U87765 SZCCT0109]MBR1346420.1 hypothetical protein [Bradyrhizobium sp. U87765 SZCCT0048]